MNYAQEIKRLNEQLQGKKEDDKVVEDLKEMLGMKDL